MAANTDGRVNPAHYQNGSRETIDTIRDRLAEIEGGFAAFCYGNAIKYADRAGLKGPRATCLDKCAWYLQMIECDLLGVVDPRIDALERYATEALTLHTELRG